MIRIARKTLLVAASALFMGAALPLQAQETIPEDHLAAARETVFASNAIRAFDNVLPLMAERTRTLFIQRDPANTAMIDEIVNEVALSLASRRPELNKVVFEVWARRFSIEELNQLTAFYKSPLGQKYSRVEPELRALSIGAAKQWGDAISTEMVTLVREELTKRQAAKTE
ncbi:DUF2059 domain-containing protein [Stappia taiwanensis]|uniref:DUF2059 domain-containing protein n=1 Tax=Stappia taiwanensis TaxID=992267 RepID=A0A838XKI6_9HYPH|nr:DUF2059 domain-containing protein [Stappia taiwanensis]MBA4611045.1 DUF2059 domain-containing protein [Stappia taiwanensis]GGE93841.1 hypothetical protein GCM10007285_21840 [Stappia taiwanensis]